MADLEKLLTALYTGFSNESAAHLVQYAVFCERVVAMLALLREISLVIFQKGHVFLFFYLKKMIASIIQLFQYMSKLL